MCNECGWEDYIEECEEMMDDSRYNFAKDTIEGIYDWIFENHHVTENQIRAIKNIKKSIYG